MSITRDKIAKAIKINTGWDVVVAGSARDGCYHFAGADEETSMELSGWYETTVYVYRLNHLELWQWVDEFKDLMTAAGATNKL